MFMSEAAPAIMSVHTVLGKGLCHDAKKDLSSQCATPGGLSIVEDAVWRAVVFFKVAPASFLRRLLGFLAA